MSQKPDTASQGHQRTSSTLQEIKMLITATPTAAPSFVETLGHQRAPVSATRSEGRRSSNQHVANMLKLLSEALTPQRRVVHAGDLIYQASEQFGNLHILNAGFIKIVGLAADGREQLVGLKFRGDWLGFDGIANGRYACDAVAMDTGEVWTFRYDALMVACASTPVLLAVLLEAMSRESAHDRDALISVCSKTADVRVGEFLCYLAESLATCGLRSDQITLRMTRAEIGNHLGLRLETVSRVMSRLARAKVIGFTGKGRRDLHIPNLDALSAHVQGRLLRPHTLQ
jgi:CRP/FNR family transcriptional regulator